jgi:flagellar basal-body rod protein FlgG
MNDSLYIAATGLRAQQLAVDTISNNLANVNTTGFKKSRVSFEETVSREAVRVSGLPADLATAARGSANGVSVHSVSKLFTTGDLKKTDDPYTVAIKGDGFVEVVQPDGSLAYTRAGRLRVNDEGLLATAEGLVLANNIRVPVDAKTIEISRGGVVTVKYGDARGTDDAGTIDLVQFANTGGLEPLGQGLYRATAAAGAPTRSLPGEAGAGELAQGYLESSNVALVDEMVNLMVAQRAYEVSAKVIQASDEMLAMSNNLRR